MASEVIFNENILNTIESQLKQSNKNIYIMHFWFTYKPLIDLLIEKNQKGLNVKVLVDFRTYLNKLEDKNKQFDISAVEYMLNNGIDCRVFKGKMMHNKVILIDEDIVITGSANLYKESLFFHNENVIILNDKNVYTKYKDEFYRLWNNEVMNKKDIIQKIIITKSNRLKNRVKKKLINLIKRYI